MNEKSFDPKPLAAFAIGGVLVGGLMWMARPADTPAQPPTVVAEVREVPAVSEALPAEREPAVVQPESKWRAAPAKARTAKPVAVKTTPSASNSAPAARPASAKAEPEGVLVKPLPNAIPANPIRVDPPSSAPEPVKTTSQIPSTRQEAPVAKREPNRVTIAAGTVVNVRLGERLSSGTNKVGDKFTATLDSPLVAEGFVIAEKGSRVEGEVASIVDGGRVKGVAEMHLELKSIRTSDGQTVKVSTDSFVRQAESSKKDDAKKVGIGAGIGAAIGAIAGGGKGAAIGAGVGGAAGAGTVLATKGKDAELAAETRMTFHLGSPVTVVEKID